MTKYILCIVYVLFSITGLTCIKLSSNMIDMRSIHIPILDIYINRVSLLGIGCYGISFLLYLGVVNKFNLGVIIPIMTGIVNISILLVSLFILKENLSLNMIIGAVVVIAGIVIMNV